jgi:hypothetical protein
MFLSVQSFLPELHWADDGSTWNQRERGHEANWTRENATYCVDSLLRIILQIQHAPFSPHAIAFEYVYEDVITANQDGVVVEAFDEMYGFFGRARRSQRKLFGTLSRGQTISGRLTPALDLTPPSMWEETSLDLADLFVISQPKTGLPGNLEPHTQLFVRAELVTLSHRVIDTPMNRRRFPHLFGRNLEGA